MYRISLVSYTNSLPFKWGIEHALSDYSLSVDYPSVCAHKLINRTADVGLVPVAALPSLKEYRIIGDYCIGANGAVDSVLMVSQVPLKQIKEVILDYQSMTSVQLARVLFKEYWNHNPVFVNAETEDYLKKVSGDTAAIIIGDRALEAKDAYPYVYDLALEWKKFSALPFVFAVWVAHESVNELWLKKLNDALKYGIDHIDNVIIQAETNRKFPVSDYLKSKISYEFNASKYRALELFTQLSGYPASLLTK